MPPHGSNVNHERTSANLEGMMLIMASSRPMTNMEANASMMAYTSTMTNTTRHAGCRSTSHAITANAHSMTSQEKSSQIPPREPTHIGIEHEQHHGQGEHGCQRGIQSAERASHERDGEGQQGEWHQHEQASGVVSVKNQMGVGAGVSISHGKSLPKVSGRNR